MRAKADASGPKTELPVLDEFSGSRIAATGNNERSCGAATQVDQ